MKKEIFNGVKWVGLLGFSCALSSCASLNSGALKAPCGPTAGLTDPCGDRIDINNIHTVEIDKFHYTVII